MYNEDLFNYLIAEVERPFAGWDFSYITGTERMVDAPLSWSYTTRVIWAKHDVQTMLDMGTGGGERLAGLQPLPMQTRGQPRVMRLTSYLHGKGLSHSV